MPVAGFNRPGDGGGGLKLGDKLNFVNNLNTKHQPATMADSVATLINKVGTLPVLPSDYIGSGFTRKQALSPQTGNTYMCARFTIDNKFLIYLAQSGTQNVWKYDIYNKTYTNLGYPAGWTTFGYGLAISDDASIIYAIGNDGFVYYWQNGTWTKITAISGIATNSTMAYFACNKDGSELYWMSSSNVLNKWVKATNTNTVIISTGTNSAGCPNGIAWVDDGSIISIPNTNPISMVKYKIADGTVLANISLPSGNAGPRNFIGMRSGSASLHGAIVAGTGTGGTDYLYKFNKDGTTTVVNSANYGYNISSGNLDGSLVTFNNTYSSGSNITFYQLLVNSNPVVTLSPSINLYDAPYFCSGDFRWGASGDFTSYAVYQ